MQIAELQSYIPQMIEDRRAIHARPEMGWEEVETTARVIERLDALGFTVLTGTQVIAPEAVLGRNAARVEAAFARARAQGVAEATLARMEGYTAAVGVLDTGRPGPTVALRFDMDALPVTEITDPASTHLPAQQGFASVFPGVMHACGHDAHTALGLAVAAWIHDHKESLKGRIKLVFQPAEEGTRGGGAMAASGIVDDADWFFAAHMGVSAKPGVIQVVKEGFLATVKFDVNFKGTPSHAGNNPELGRSALIAAANAAVLLTAIPRTSQGATRISVGKLEAGEGRNVTPVHAHLECEVRGATHEANQYMFERAKAVIEGAALAAGVEAEIIRTGEATTYVTTDAACEAMLRAAGAIEGIEAQYAPYCYGSEDCTMLIRRVYENGGQPGFFLCGCRHTGHHRPDFDVQDTENLAPGLAVFVNLLQDLSGR